MGQSPQQLHNSVQNTIRIFNEYRLDKKSPENGVFTVHSTEGGSIFFHLQYFDIEGGTQLNVSAGKPVWNKIGDNTIVPLVESFFDRLDQVNSGKIVLTPDVVNRDVYKSGQAVSGAIWLIRAIVAAAAIIIGLMALLH